MKTVTVTAVEYRDDGTPMVELYPWNERYPRCSFPWRRDAVPDVGSTLNIGGASQDDFDRANREGLRIGARSATR